MADLSSDKRASQALAPLSFTEWLRGWRYFVWFLAALLVVALFYAEENWRGRRAWARYQREMRARGEFTNRNDFIPAPVPYDQNFATTPLLNSAFGARSLQGFKGFTTAVGMAGEYSAGHRGSRSGIAREANTWTGPPADLAVWRQVLLKATNQTLVCRERLVATNFTVTDAAEAVLSALADCEPAFVELRAASQRPHSRFNIAYEQSDPATILLPHLAALKQLSQLARLRSAANLALGRENAAFEDIELMLRLTEAMRTEPILISQLVRAAQLQMALQPIAQGMPAWSDEQLRMLINDLARFDFCADFAFVLRAERSFFGDGLIEHLRRQDDLPRILSGYGYGGQKQPAGLEWAGVLLSAVPEGWFDLEHLNYNLFFQDYLLPTIDATNRLLSPDASARAEARLQALYKHSAAGLLLKQKLFCGLLLPHFSEMAQTTGMAQTGADLAALACALELYRRRHGQFPDTLSRLVPDFIVRVPHDIINGHPLKYRWRDHGTYVLYSVGWNETDDGGQVVLGKGGEWDRLSGDWVW